MIPVTHKKHDFAVEQVSFLETIKTKVAQKCSKGFEFKHPLDDNPVIIGKDVKKVLFRQPMQCEKCVIDWLNVTITCDQFCAAMPNYVDIDKQEQIVCFVGEQLAQIIGFGIESENPSGRNFYDRSFALEHNLGFVAIGGQRNTLMICINGTGCNYAYLNWEARMFDWLSGLDANCVNITRIDLAHDILQPKDLTIDTFNKLHTDGGFSKGGRPPEIEYRGNWKKPNGQGRTLYIGSRQSSKYCRIYEKGKQLGDTDSPWLRIEVEYKSNDIFIPLEVLKNPTDYFFATYPCFSLLEDSFFEKRFCVRQKQELMTFEQAINIVKKQYGRYLLLFRQCFGSDKEMLDILTDIKNKDLPERLNYLSIPKELTPSPQVLHLINQAKGA